MRLSSPFVPLGVLSATFAYAVISYGAVEPRTVSVCLIASAGIGLLYGLLAPRANWSPAMSKTLFWLTAAAPAYVAFQLVPLPISWIAALSPAKAELTASLSRAGSSISITQLAVNPSATLSYFCRILAYLMIFLLVRQFVWRMADKPWVVVFPFLGIGIAESFWGLLQCHHSGAACKFVTGTYVNRNHFAGLLEMCFPFALNYPFFLISKANRTWVSNLTETLTIGLLLLGAAIIVIAVFASLSRTGAVIILLSLSGLLVTHIGKSLPTRWKLIGILSLVVLLLAVSFVASPSALVRRFSELSDPHSAGMDRRIIWKQTINLIKDYPVFGCGLGGYASSYLKFKAGIPLWETSFVHNDYLQGLAELGLAGSLLFGGFVARMLIPIVRIIYVRGDFEIKMLALACGTALLSMLAHSFDDFNFYIPANAMGFAWICGVAAALPHLRDTSVLPCRSKKQAFHSARSLGGQYKCGTSF
jgi:O-antigen ligase